MTPRNGYTPNHAIVDEASRLIRMESTYVGGEPASVRFYDGTSMSLLHEERRDSQSGIVYEIGAAGMVHDPKGGIELPSGRPAIPVSREALEAGQPPDRLADYWRWVESPSYGYRVGPRWHAQGCYGKPDGGPGSVCTCVIVRAGKRNRRW